MIKALAGKRCKTQTAIFRNPSLFLEPAQIYPAWTASCFYPLHTGPTGCLKISPAAKRITGLTITIRQIMTVNGRV